MNYIGIKHNRSVTKSVKQFIASRQNYICKWCKQPLENTYQVDHDRPLWHGGSNEIANLQALCPNCHARKTRYEMSIMPRKKKINNLTFLFCPMCLGKFSPYFNHFCGLLRSIEPIAMKPL